MSIYIAYLQICRWKGSGG